MPDFTRGGSPSDLTQGSLIQVNMVEMWCMIAGAVIRLLESMPWYSPAACALCWVVLITVGKHNP